MPEQTKAFIQLIREQEKLIYKVCHIYGELAEDRKDLFQEIVIQAWIAYPRFNNQSKVSTWLYRVALNTAINHQRNKKKHISTDTSWLSDHIADSLHTPNEEYKIMHRLIADLPPLEKAIVLLYLEDNSHQAIADIIGLSVSNVGTRLARIKEKLKKQAQIIVNN